MARPLPLAPVLAKAGSSAPVDPLAPCRALVDLYCNPELVDSTHCALEKGKLAAAQSRPAGEHAAEGRFCQAMLTGVAKEVKERLDRLNGRPTTHFGNVSDAVLDAKLPGCATLRRSVCEYPREHSAVCQNTIRFIDRAVTGTPAQQAEARAYCSGGANWDADDKLEFAKYRDGGAPSAIVSPEGAP